MDPHIVALVMLGILVAVIMIGFPVAFTLMALGVIFGYWAYFTFGHVSEAQYAAVTALEPVDACNACHAANAGRDFVFIQHYPVLRGAEARVRR